MKIKVLITFLIGSAAPLIASGNCGELQSLRSEQRQANNDFRRKCGNFTRCVYQAENLKRVGASALKVIGAQGCYEGGGGPPGGGLGDRVSRLGENCFTSAAIARTATSVRILNTNLQNFRNQCRDFSECRGLMEKLGQLNGQIEKAEQSCRSQQQGGDDGVPGQNSPYPYGGGGEGSLSP